MDCPDEKCQERLMELVACSRTKVTVRQLLAGSATLCGLILIIMVALSQHGYTLYAEQKVKSENNKEQVQVIKNEMQHMKQDIQKLQTGQEEIKRNQMTPYQFKAIIEDALKKVKGDK